MTTRSEDEAMASGLILVDIQNEYFPGGRMELTGIREASPTPGSS